MSTSHQHKMMMQRFQQSPVHDYKTKFVLPAELTNENVLVGESGGLSAIYEADNHMVIGGIPVVTEHGTIYLDPGTRVEVLAEDPYIETEEDGIPAETQNMIEDLP